MFRITPITNNLFAAPAAMASRAQGVTPSKPAKPAFGLESISFGAKTVSAKLVTPKLDMSQPPGKRLNILA